MMGKTDGFYTLLPKMDVYDTYNEDVISKAVMRQKGKIDNVAFLVLDDCLLDGIRLKSEAINHLFVWAQHLNMMFIIGMSYAWSIRPDLQSNIDFVFIFKDDIVANRKRIFESYGNMFPSFDVLCQIMDQYSKNFECLVIDRTARGTKWEDYVFWYKAEPP